IHPRGRPVAGTVSVPGSKSLTNRALVAAALADPAASRLHAPLDAEDTAAMRRSLRSLGVLIDDNDDPWLVLGTGGRLEEPEEVVDVGASGTTARFITAVASLARGRVVVDGIPRMRERPIGPLVEALEALGVQIHSRQGYPPVEVHGTGRLAGGKVTVDASLSSQFASALLLVAPMAEGTVEIDLAPPVVSRPYLEGTVETMRVFGARVTAEGDRFVVQPGGYRKAHVHIEPDASAAVYPAVAAALTGGRVEIPGIPPASSQPDLAVLGVLEQMGCRVVREESGILVEGPQEGLAPIDVDMGMAPDGAMAVAVAAGAAHGPSVIRGLSTLRLKETDRLAALEAELGKIGVDARVEGDSLRIRPGPWHGATIETYGDHRMAMALALVGLMVDGIVIDDPGVVSKTWPGYFEMLASL
ncbi:MAG: 3-phosphoshikimate 1-carboxyvinyltransferase, partial [Actinomycetota bacterium]